jgi:hypothetical protein
VQGTDTTLFAPDFIVFNINPCPTPMKEKVVQGMPFGYKQNIGVYFGIRSKNNDKKVFPSSVI